MSAKRLTHEERAEIYRLWKEEGLTYRAIAKLCEVNPATVGNVVKKMNGTPGKSQINKEFDAAVNDMIAESKAASPIVDTSDTKSDTSGTKKDTPNVTDAVMTAVVERINALSETLSDNMLTIKEMQQDNENLRSELAILHGWRVEHESTEN